MYMFTSRDFLLDAKVYKFDLKIINKSLTTIGIEKRLSEFTLSNLQYALVGFDS